LYEVIVLRPGYASWTGPATQKAGGTITLLRGRYNVIVDTGNPCDRPILVKALASESLRLRDIHYVVCTHGHSDHVGNNSLFPKATFIVSYDISRGDQYTFHNFQKQGPYRIDDDVEIIYTPGHTKQDISVLVRTRRGIVAVTGDLFESEKDLTDDQLWHQFSEYQEEQQESRRKILDVADYVVPGHGDIFEVAGVSRHDGKTGARKESDLGAFFLRYSAEIARCIERFETFWSAVNESRVLAWLKQFPEREGKAAALKLLSHVEFYGPRMVTELLQKLHMLLPKGYSGLYVVGHGPPAKSGVHLLYEYRLANKLPEAGVVEIANLHAILTDPGLERKAIVFLDDIIGTGSEAARFVHDVNVGAPGAAEALRKCDKYLIALVGTEWGIANVAKQNMFRDVIVARRLLESDKAFSPKGAVFEYEDERLSARRMVEAVGSQLYPRNPKKPDGPGPLGYGDCELLVVFYYNTPNNTLPILWKDGVVDGAPWMPLFPRREG